MSRNRILLIEDNEDNFELVRFLLERAGYQVLPARVDARVLKLLRKNNPT